MFRKKEFCFPSLGNFSSGANRRLGFPLRRPWLLEPWPLALLHHWLTAAWHLLLTKTVSHELLHPPSFSSSNWGQSNFPASYISVQRKRFEIPRHKAKREEH